jgi:hypothetical protein
MQSIKQLTDASLSMGCMSCLYICLYAQFEVLQTTRRLRAVHALRARTSRLHSPSVGGTNCKKHPAALHRRPARRLTRRRGRPVPRRRDDARRRPTTRCGTRLHPSSPGWDPALRLLPLAPAKKPRSPLILPPNAKLRALPRQISPPGSPSSPLRRRLLAPSPRRTWCSGMSTPSATRRKNGSSPAALDAAAGAPGRTLGRGGVGAATASGLPFGRGGLSTPPSRSLGPRGVGLPPPPRSRGLGGGSVAPSSIEGFVRGDFPSSAGFSFPSASSQPLFDAASVDPSSPGAW